MISNISKIAKIWPVVVRRSLSHWRLLSSVMIGVLLASSILAGTVIYFEALREIALTSALDKLTPQETNILIKAQRGPTTNQEFQKVETTSQNQIDRLISGMVSNIDHAGRSATFFLTEKGNETAAGEDDFRGYFAYVPNIVQHITISSGTQYSSETPSYVKGDIPTLGALIPSDVAMTYDVEVGDKLSAVPFWDDTISHGEVEITGIFNRNNPDATFWQMDDTFIGAATVSDSFRTIPFYISQSEYFQVLGQAFTSLDTSYVWLLYIDRSVLNSLNSTSAELAIGTMKTNLSNDLYSYRQITELDETLREYDQRLFYSKIPMFILMVLIAIVVLYYVVTLSSLLIEQQQGEIALLRSRGATSRQVLTVFIIEGITLSFLAILLAPLLASAAIWTLGLTSAFEGLSSDGRITVVITKTAYAISAVGGLMSFVALMIPAAQASKLTVTQYRQQSARPNESPVFQRFYLDVMLLIISVFLLKQLSDQGSVVATGLFGETVVNQVMFAVPGLVLVALALVMLRLFPLTIRFLSGDSPSLIHLIVGVALGIQGTSLIFKYAFLGQESQWLPQIGLLLAMAVLYVLTERWSDKRFKIVGIITQTLIVSICLLVAYEIPIVRFLAFNIGNLEVLPGIVGGVFIFSAATTDGSWFIPIPFSLAIIVVKSLADRAPIGYSMGMWQMARNPTHYARLSLLLILMSGLGIFAASFGGTLERSFKDQALYSAGADIRLEDISISSLGESRGVEETYQKLDSVNLASAVLRASGRTNEGLLGDQFTMLGVSGDPIKNIGWFRPDFSSKEMPDLLTSLEHGSPPVGISIPKNAVSIGARIKPDRPHPRVAVIIRARDANDRYFDYIVGLLENNDWTELESSIQDGRQYGRRMQGKTLQPAFPLTLMSMTIYNINARSVLDAGGIHIDEIWTTDGTGQRTTLESFNSPSEWTPLRSARESHIDSLQMSTLAFNDSKPGVLFLWSQGSPLSARGIYHGPKSDPIPVLASESFLEKTGHQINDEFYVSVSGHRLPVIIVENFRYFPTLNTETELFLIGDFKSITRYANLESRSAELKPNEMWISTDASGLERLQLVKSLESGENLFEVKNIYDKEALLSESAVDPLVQAGWRTLLFMAFGAVLILSCLGFLVHAYVSFREREMQFGLMRTIGFSMRQLIALVVLEQTLVIVTGMALGAEMGRRLGSIIMPFLSHTDQGTQVLPPFVIEVDWATLGFTYGFMIIVFSLVIVGMILFIRRISLQRILRLGEV